MALRILLADDSQHAQRDGSRILSELGYEVVTVNNGAAALQRLEEAAFDLVIADTSMPGLTGLEVCERIRQRPEWAGLPVLLALAAFELFDAGQGKRAGADEVIQKPFIPSALERAVQELLSRAGKLPADSAAAAPPEPEPLSVGIASAEAVPESLPQSSPLPLPVRSESWSADSVPPVQDVELSLPASGRPRWETAVPEAADEAPNTDFSSAENAEALEPPHAALPPAAPEPLLAMAAAASAPAAIPSSLVPSAPWLVPPATASVPPPLPPEPEDVLLIAWREAMSAPAATAPRVELAAALNAVDEVLARFLAPMIAGEASEEVASRLRALAR